MEVLEVWRVDGWFGASTRLEARGLGGLTSLRDSRRGTSRLRDLQVSGKKVKLDLKDLLDFGTTFGV